MQLVFATNNKNKLTEVRALVPNAIQILSLSDINCHEDIPETQKTIEGNARQKADFIKLHYGYDCFGDDTGLEVDVLNGAPGVYSARYAGPERNANANMDKLLDKLAKKDNRTAQFKTVIALHLNDTFYEFTGVCRGQITRKKKGNQGFGYDPIFRPEGYKSTFAEMDLTLKNQIGHRGKAVQQLVSFLNQIKKC